MIRVWLGTFYQYLIQAQKVTMMMTIQILTLKIIIKNGTVIVVKVVGLQMKKLKYLRNDWKAKTKEQSQTS